MKYMITRTNGNVVQVWEKNEASWHFFLAHQSKDVHWRNMDGKEDPWLFDDFFEASEKLQKRQKYLGPIEKKTEHQWTYHIVKENFYVGSGQN